jgi:hypothetical protein
VRLVLGGIDTDGALQGFVIRLKVFGTQLGLFHYLMNRRVPDIRENVWWGIGRNRGDVNLQRGFGKLSKGGRETSSLLGMVVMEVDWFSIWTLVLVGEGYPRSSLLCFLLRRDILQLPNITR